MKRLLLALPLLFALPVRAEDIELSADNGLEWNQKDRKITLSENARAKSKDYDLAADSIEAMYRGDKKIYKIFALGSVRVKSAAETITADRMAYDLDSETINLSSDGTPTRMKTKDSEIIAKGEVAYYKSRSFATASEAEIVHEGKRLLADDIRIDFVKGKEEVAKIVAKGDIRLKDGEETLEGDEAVYDPKAGLATITGGVHLKKGSAASLSGDRIVYDMNTGVARILPKAGAKVVGTFSTDKDSTDKK
jgi:lipopolysaccharide assembly outer membrane protein LptD (OstA)